MVTDSQELANYSLYFATNLHFQQRNTDALLINYRYGVGQSSSNCQNQAQLFSSHSDLITLMSSVNNSITSQEALLYKKKRKKKK